MSERRKVPVAYVTKWAEADGILVTKDDEATDYGNGKLYLYVGRRGLSVPSSHWTEDKAEAERRYASALKKREKALAENLKAIRQAISDGPRYTEES